METSVKAADVVVAPQPEVASSPPQAEGAAAPPAASSSSSSSSSASFDPMEEFSRRLQDIVSSHGAASAVLDKLTAVEAETEKMKKEAKEDMAVATETDVTLVLQSLKQLGSPEKKLQDLVRRHAEMAALRRCDERKQCVLQQRLSVLLDERQQLQAEARSSVAARSQLEALCRELQEHYGRLREETLRRCREDEEKRTEMTGHFQTMLTEIQAQIEQHSARNDKLCRENSNLTDKLEGLMAQCEHREESLEKINERRDLQHKLTEAKLQQANAMLSEAEEKHQREKEYLLREAIEKTKKCFAMKEQELAMKKKLLVQAAEWKLQAQTYREQGTVMQAQLTLYAQKFDEFQETLAKSNEIYVRFKKEMDNMSDKMKKLEKESNLWKTRFENCNKALTDMIQERTEKNNEYDVFVLKIQKLEKLCHALQTERAMLYEKIKEVRHSNANIPAKLFASCTPEEPRDAEEAGKSSGPTHVEAQEIQEEDPVLTEGMTRLKEEQAKLQEFAASLLATPSDEEEEVKDDLPAEEDLVASAFDGFKTKPKVEKGPAPVPEKVEEVKPDTTEEVPKPSVENKTEEKPADPKPEAAEGPRQDEEPEKPAEMIQQEPAEEVKPVIPVKEEEVQAKPVQEAPPSKSSPVTSSSTSDSSKKQTPKKKKKRNNKNAS